MVTEYIDGQVWSLLMTWKEYMYAEQYGRGLPHASAFARDLGGINCVEDWEDETDARVAHVVDTIMDDMMRSDPRLCLALRKEVLHESWEYRGDRAEVLPLANDEFRRRAVKASILFGRT